MRQMSDPDPRGTAAKAPWDHGTLPIRMPTAIIAAEVPLQ